MTAAVVAVVTLAAVVLKAVSVIFSVVTVVQAYVCSETASVTATFSAVLLPLHAVIRNEQAARKAITDFFIYSY